MARILKFRVLFIPLIAVLLFPCVSFTDDLILLQNLTFNANTLDDGIAAAPGRSFGEAESVIEVLLRELEHLQILDFYSLAIAIFVSSLVVAGSVSQPIWRLRLDGGRSPPQ